VRALLSTLTAGARDLWERAKSERATPREIGWAFGVGVWIGFSPFLGLHLGIAFAAATVFRLNRLWAMVGSRVSVAPLLVTMAFIEVESAHRLRTGAWLPMTAAAIVAHGRELFLDWLLGACLVATPLAAGLGFLAYALARGQGRLRPRTPDAPLARSSGSRPSTPPAPTP
jgi:uncharacterized protein (DUF2062 family)